jgi:YD repeat-containing protein
MGSVYGFDGVGNLTSVTDSYDASANRSMGYDDMNRLTSYTVPWATATVSYDAGGNITSQVIGSYRLNYAYDASNRLVTLSGSRSASLSYDAHGNVVGADGGLYAYDAVPNLRCVNCGSGGSIAYGYDGTNRRAWVVKDGAKTYELYDSRDRLVGQYSSNKTVEYIYLASKRVAQRAVP